MSIKKLFAILVAVAVLFAPAFTRAGAAFAAAPDHHAPMMEAGHCSMAPAEGSGDPAEPAETCCVSMCMPVAIAPSMAASHQVPQAALLAMIAETFGLGLLPEIATPPPRSA